ncbi:MAG TPA: hypothetical protein VFN67_23435 [Polyangiales bacterium]|nr:hypothetical protein [Polyangiales bacterium]
MRSLFRSDSAYVHCRRALHVGSFVILAAACGGGATRPVPEDKPSDEGASVASWTVKRSRGSAAADSGVVAAHDAGKPTSPEPKPAADSGTPVTPNTPQDAGVAEPDVEPAPAASIVLSGAPEPSGTAPVVDSFSLSTVPDLYVYTAWSNLCGEHTELRKYYDPSGELFYQKLTAFSTDISEPVPLTRKVGVPHNTSVLPAIPDAQGAFVMQDNIGLAGSWIGAHSITGTWKLELYLDDAKTPIATRSFELTP